MADADLIQHYKQTEDKKYVGELFNRYSHLVYGVGLKYLKNTANAKDMVMEVFEKLMKDLLKSDVQNFKAWLHVVTRNQCLMQLRKQSRNVGREQNIDDVGYNLENQDEIELSEKQALEQEINTLEEAIHLLKPAQKDCVELFYIQQKCYQEVADITGFTLKQVKSYIQNGKRNLKLILTKNNVSVQ